MFRMSCWSEEAGLADQRRERVKKSVSGKREFPYK
jgi:hypothetical protein